MFQTQVSATTRCVGPFALCFWCACIVLSSGNRTMGYPQVTKNERLPVSTETHDKTVTNRTSSSEPEVLDLWPTELHGRLPGDPLDLSLPPETDTTGENGREVAGGRVIRLGNVSTPQIAVYRPTNPNESRAAVVICPGGGYSILAYDLEGTEVAQWLNDRGYTAVVLKYRVPARAGVERWKVGVTDAQRAISLVRSKAETWGLDPHRIGILGFSAGGHAAALTSSGLPRQYEPADNADTQSCRPNFSLLIYPAYLVNAAGDGLSDEMSALEGFPPTFLVHALDDGVTPLSSLILATQLKRIGADAELHLFREGGHGYGLRRTNLPVSRWTDMADPWLNRVLPTRSE